MRLKRVNFRFNRLVNVDDIIGHSNLLLMEQEDINVDNNVHDCILRIICANFYIIAYTNNHKSFYIVVLLIISLLFLRF